ncbi:MAG: carboxypeptidase-like regulatory domain-containing protein [Bacteroidota bacterium]
MNKATDLDKKIRVSGVVLDSEGNPLLGTSIIIKNTIERTQSDELGKYSISANLNDILQFTFLGFENKEVIVTSNEVNVQLVEENIDVTMVGGAFKRQTFFGRTFRKIGNWFR